MPKALALGLGLLIFIPSHAASYSDAEKNELATNCEQQLQAKGIEIPLGVQILRALSRPENEVRTALAEFVFQREEELEDELNPELLKLIRHILNFNETQFTELPAWISLEDLVFEINDIVAQSKYTKRFIDDQFYTRGQQRVKEDTGETGYAQSFK